MILASDEVVIWPKVLLFRVVFGFPFLRLFVTLNASARNSRLWASRGLKILDSPKSNCQVPDPQCSPASCFQSCPYRAVQKPWDSGSSVNSGQGMDFRVPGSAADYRPVRITRDPDRW